MLYKKVDEEYLRKKILNNEYKKLEVKKVGLVKARYLSKGEKVVVYFYNENAEIDKNTFYVNDDSSVLVTKKINNVEVSCVMTGLRFAKTYTKLHKSQLWKPVEAPFFVYEVNESIEINNCYKQTAKLKSSDFIAPLDQRLLHFYSIFSYNFNENYVIVKQKEKSRLNFMDESEMFDEPF